MNSSSWLNNLGLNSWMSSRALVLILGILSLIVLTSRVQVTRKDLLKTWKDLKVIPKDYIHLEGLSPEDSWSSQVVESLEMVKKLEQEGYEINPNIREIQNTGKPFDPVVYQIVSNGEVYYVIYE